MDVEAALHDLTAALAAAESAHRGDVSLRAARQVVVRRCAEALGIEGRATPSLPAVIRLAADASDQSPRRDCAVLLMHALAVPALVPQAAADAVCRLAENGLRGALLRSGYPFGGSLDDRIRVLQRLHSQIDELMRPLEPTFPSWIQGLHAG